MDQQTPEERHRGYLDRAEEARRSALRATDHQAKQSFEGLANSWLLLAEHVARMARIKPELTL